MPFAKIPMVAGSAGGVCCEVGPELTWPASNLNLTQQHPGLFISLSNTVIDVMISDGVPVTDIITTYPAISAVGGPVCCLVLHAASASHLDALSQPGHEDLP
jgi:hypothetical protein